VSWTYWGSKTIEFGAEPEYKTSDAFKILGFKVQGPSEVKIGSNASFDITVKYFYNPVVAAKLNLASPRFKVRAVILSPEGKTIASLDEEHLDTTAYPSSDNTFVITDEYTFTVPSLEPGNYKIRFDLYYEI